MILIICLLAVGQGGVMEHGAVLDPEDGSKNAAEQITLRAEVEDVRVRIIASGEVDLATISALGAFISSAFRPGIAEMVIDLTKVTFLDTSGVSVLLVASREAAGLGVGFSLLCPTGNAAVSLVLDTLQIGSVMTVVRTSP